MFTAAMIDRAMGGCPECLEVIEECICEMEAASKAEWFYDMEKHDE